MKIFLSIIALAIVAGTAAAASPDSTQGKAVSYGNQDNIGLPQAREYDHYLSRVLNALRGIDPTMGAELPSWSVNDRELKRRIIAAMQKNPEFRSRIDQTAEVIVTQNPRTNDILQLSVGPVLLHSRQEIEADLGNSVYEKLKDGNYDKLVKTNPAEERRNYSINFSFYRGSIVLEKSGFAFEWINGKEEIGYPFWLNGTMTLGGAFIRDNVTAHLGIDLVPNNYGNSTAKILGPFTLQQRLLEGAGGASGSLTVKNLGLDPSDGTLGATGLFTYSFGIDNSKTGFSLSQSDVYNTSLIGLVYGTYTFANAGSMPGISVSLGGGAHRIDHLQSIPQKTDVKVVSRTMYGDPFGRIAYDHVGEDKYGIAVQYSNLLLASAYYEFIGGFGLELKYALRLNHRNDPWEHDSFFIVSPRISISL